MKSWCSCKNFTKRAWFENNESFLRFSVCQRQWRKPDFKKHDVLGRVHRAAWPEVEQRAGRTSGRPFTVLTSAAGEDKRLEDQPRKGSGPPEPGGHHPGPEQHPGPPAPRGEGRRARLPALQPRSAHVVWPVWRLHLGPLQAEPAVCQWVGLRLTCVCVRECVHVQPRLCLCRISNQSSTERNNKFSLNREICIQQHCADYPSLFSFDVIWYGKKLKSNMLKQFEWVCWPTII